MPSIESLELVRNKGPLLTTALALFGPNSWLDLVNRYSDLYEHHNITTNSTNTIICIDTAPLSRILNLNTLTTNNPSSSLFQINPINTCINPISPNQNPRGSTNALLAGSWLYNFQTPTAAGDSTHVYNFMNSTTASGNVYLANAFTIAAYLSNMAWMAEGNAISNTLTVAFDMGADSQKPAISRAGILVVSVLIGVDLVGLLVTAVYASWFPRWTGALDALSLLRIGGRVGEWLPLRVVVDETEVGVLDELPGWVGGDVDGKGERNGDGDGVERIALGGMSALRKGVVYEAYDEMELRKRRWGSRRLRR
ncbi:hypothetical protein ASPCADRAFT_508493 [Aspergillus carbonarius ITEM 5010]|uniref:Uncharacterized protein n=1 Tax=Aspergillus carbonarius (strain ITEM 5010) TaxID=602072 RepID=A0A1R3RFT3_ASPC5|nr:hypothetical protein ASPCADRAFT_508493 [Aspergillus carbonarius ITEM 5010]